VEYSLTKNDLSVSQQRDATNRSHQFGTSRNKDLLRHSSNNVSFTLYNFNRLDKDKTAYSLFYSDSANKTEEVFYLRKLLILIAKPFSSGEIEAFDLTKYQQEIEDFVQWRKEINQFIMKLKTKCTTFSVGPLIKDGNEGSRNETDENPMTSPEMGLKRDFRRKFTANTMEAIPEDTELDEHSVQDKKDAKITIDIQPIEKKRVNLSYEIPRGNQMKVIKKVSSDGSDSDSDEFYSPGFMNGPGFMSLSMHHHPGTKSHNLKNVLHYVPEDSNENQSSPDNGPAHLELQKIDPDAPIWSKMHSNNNRRMKNKPNSFETQDKFTKSGTLTSQKSRHCYSVADAYDENDVEEADSKVINFVNKKLTWNKSKGTDLNKYSLIMKDNLDTQKTMEHDTKEENDQSEDIMKLGDHFELTQESEQIKLTGGTDSVLSSITDRSRTPLIKEHNP